MVSIFESSVFFFVSFGRCYCCCLNVDIIRTGDLWAGFIKIHRICFFSFLFSSLLSYFLVMPRLYSFLMNLCRFVCFVNHREKLKANIEIFTERKSESKKAHTTNGTSNNTVDSKCLLFIACMIICRYLVSMPFFPRHIQMYIDFAVAYLLRLIVLNFAHKNSNVFAHLSDNLYTTTTHNTYRTVYVRVYVHNVKTKQYFVCKY